MCEYQSVECAFTSPVSIEPGMLVTCRIQCLCPRCCSVVTSCLLVESMCILISCSSVLMAVGMFMFVKVMSSLISVISPPLCLCVWCCSGVFLVF